MSFGFIGTGNMGGALARAVAKAVDPKEVFLANRTAQKAELLAQETGAQHTDDKYIVEKADYIFLGVKPQMMKGLLTDLKENLTKRSLKNERFILVTMAAGLEIDTIKNMAGGDYPVIRIMPNTPVGIGEGVVLVCYDDHITEEEKQTFKDALKESGLIVEIPENLIDAGCCISGCGPAFVDMFVEALADGGVACGLPRKTALLLASQMTAGAAKLILESGKHPAQLKDEVCSPGGSTIEGVRGLENAGFRGALMNAVFFANLKNEQLKKH